MSNQTLDVINIINQLDQAHKDVALGSIEAIELIIALKQIKDKISNIENLSSEDFLRSAKDYNKSTFKGYAISIREGGGRYDYSHIDSYNVLNAKLKDIQDNAKNSYKMALKGSVMVLDGEQIEPAKFTPSKDAIIISKIVEKS